MRAKLLFGILTIFVFAAIPLQAQTLDSIALAIADRVQDNDGRWADEGDERQIALINGYDAAGYKPIWVDANGMTGKGQALIAMLQASDQDGLHPSDYLTPELKTAMTASDPSALANLDVILSFTLLNYAHHIGAGRVEPSAINSDLRISPEGPDLEATLATARSTTDMAAFAASIAPSAPRYQRLKQGLATYREIVAAGGWIQVPGPQTGKSLKPGMTDPMVPILARRLVQANQLAEADFDFATGPELYEGAIVDAVKRFQNSLALEIDGVIGPNTLKQINITAEQRVKQLEVNLERRRWMPDDLGNYYVFVNLADQYLKVVKKVEKNGKLREKTLHAARAVVGKTYHKTPVFTELMTYMVLNPNWNVPYSIATKEYLPKLKANPGALQRQNIRVLSGGRKISPFAVNWSAYSRGNFPFRLQQASGPKNALGRVKFMFPNKYNIYIHDTPSKSLFKKASRVFSHGCVRVQDPLKLAEVILGPEGVARSKIDGIINRGKRRVVKLKTPIPVHITYLTAWVNKDGSVHFRRDVYGRDAILEKALGRVQVASN